MSAKTEGDTQVFHIDWIPESVLAELGDLSSIAFSTSKVLLKTSALGVIENNFDGYHKKLMEEKGNFNARLFRMINFKRHIMSDPSRDWSAVSPIAADLENFHVDVSSIHFAGKKQLLVTMTFDPIILKRLNTTMTDVQSHLVETNFVMMGRSVPLSLLNSTAVGAIIEDGKYSIAVTHAEITEEEHLFSDHIAKLVLNCHANTGEVSLNTLRQRALPKVGFVSEQQLTPANAAKKVQAGAVGISEKQGKKFETTTHPTIDSIGLKSSENQELQNYLVAFQRNGFKETTVRINSKRIVTIKLFPWNRFDSQGRTGKDKENTTRKGSKTKTTSKKRKT